MASVEVDHSQAEKKLFAAWDRTADLTVVAPATVVPHLEAVLSAPDVTFKYILVTGLLAKCVNPAVHPRALQVASKLKSAYDARSLCHEVVVKFEKPKGDLWGLSNEPSVNKQARHPEHKKTNKQLRNRKLAASLHDALEFANGASADEVFAMFVHVLRLSQQRAAAQPTANLQVETSYRRVIDFVSTFLRETDGGSRLVAVVGAFVTLLNEGQTVKVFPPNYADEFAKTAGDIELYQDDTLVSAYECKQRPVTLDDICHGIRKANERGPLEYCFIYSAGLAADEEEAICREVLAEGAYRDVLLLDIHAVFEAWAAALNRLRQAKFGETAVRLLREDLRRADVAAQAADVWNSIK